MVKMPSMNVQAVYTDVGPQLDGGILITRSPACKEGRIRAEGKAMHPESVTSGGNSMNDIATIPNGVDTRSSAGTPLSYSDLPGYQPGTVIMKYADSSD